MGINVDSRVLLDFEPVIVLQDCKSKQKQFQVHNSYKTRK